jgi:UDP-glucose 4-epimerase
MSKVLVTGGAGYIGSHVVRQLGERGEAVVVLDNLSTGFRSSVLHGDLVIGDTGDERLVAEVLEQHRVDAILHFAAHIVVPESVSHPLKYYRNNTANTRTLLECALRAGVPHFIFSSTAAVYGMPPGGIARESSPTAPINPYGSSKLMSEWMLRDVSASSSLRHVALRYFNVAGADLQARIGQSSREATHLIKIACEAVVGKRGEVGVFGTDYPTPDGTCIRDYVHVEDLARAHLLALDHLRAGGESATLNCGYGRGYSVLEVLDAVDRVAGLRIQRRVQARRPGDPPQLVSNAERIREVLRWEPQHDNLDDIVSSAIEWERRLVRHPVS